MGNYHCGSAILQAELTRQRRHRKWALKKARSYLHDPCAEMNAFFEDLKSERTFWQKRTIEAEAEVKRLKAILAHQGRVF